MSAEVKVNLTLYYKVDADSNHEAIEQVKELVAEELNGQASDWAEYEVVNSVY